MNWESRIIWRVLVDPGGVTFHSPVALVRQESLGKEEAKAETFHRNPAGNQARPAELASGRKRVLRGTGATRAAKRRQRVSGSCD